MGNTLLVTPEENKSSLVNGLIKFLNNYIKYDLSIGLEIGDEIPINGSGQYITLDEELSNALKETFNEVENKIKNKDYDHEINKQKIKSLIPNEILVTLINKIYSNNIKIKTSKNLETILKNPELKSDGIEEESLTLYDVVELLDRSYDYPINAGDKIKLKSGIIEITEEFYNALKKEVYDYEKKNFREKEFKEYYNEKEIQIIDDWETTDTNGMKEIHENLMNEMNNNDEFTVYPDNAEKVDSENIYKYHLSPKFEKLLEDPNDLMQNKLMNLQMFISNPQDHPLNNESKKFIKMLNPEFNPEKDNPEDLTGVIQNLNNYLFTLIYSPTQNLEVAVDDSKFLAGVKNSLKSFYEQAEKELNNKIKKGAAISPEELTEITRGHMRLISLFKENKDNNYVYAGNNTANELSQFLDYFTRGQIRNDLSNLESDYEPSRIIKYLRINLDDVDKQSMTKDIIESLKIYKNGKDIESVKQYLIQTKEYEEDDIKEAINKISNYFKPQSKNLKRASDTKKGMTKSLTELFTLDELINKLTESNINLGEEIKGYAVTSQDLENFKEELRTYGISFKKLKESMSVYRVKDGEQTLPQKIENFYSSKNPATKGSKFDTLYERIDKTKETAMKALKNLTELEGILNKTVKYETEHQEVNKLINEYKKLSKVNDYTPLTGIKDYLNNLSNKVIEVGEDDINLDGVINGFENQISTIEKNISNLDNEISEAKKIKISCTPKLNENLKNALDKCYDRIEEITKNYNRMNKKMEKLDNIYKSR